MKGILIFAAGVAVGSLAAWYLSKKVYEQKVDNSEEYYKDEDEEESVSENDIFNELAERAKNKPAPKDIHTYAKIATAYSADKEEKPTVKKPRKVTLPEWKRSEYDWFTYDYYSDGVLANADDPDTPISDVKSVVGDIFEDFDASTLEPPYTDWLYVLDDAKERKYEICINNKPFEEREY